MMVSSRPTRTSRAVFGSTACPRQTAAATAPMSCGSRIVLSEQLAAIAAKPERIVAGYMGGTSLDGIDVAVTRIRGSGVGSGVQLLGFLSVPYEPELRRRLFNLQMPETFSGGEMAELSFLVAELYAQALLDLMGQLDLPVSALDLIGHHGVIVFHGGGLHVDICEASVIAERTGCTVITDFRVRDCAAGGQGAPLSPYVDWILFRDPEKNRAVQNIGGIGNVCAVPAGGEVDDLIGLDTGPGNMIIDGLVRLITGGEQTYDRDGAMAASGRIRDDVLSELMAHPFIAKELPRSAGREQFGIFFSRGLLDRSRSRRIPDEDVVATATRFTAQAIADAYQRFITPYMQIDEVIIGGGGVHNPTLMSWIARLLAPVPVRTHDDYGIPSDAREAISWAVLANETLLGRPANVRQVTGARRRAVLGKIIPGVEAA